MTRYKQEQRRKSVIVVVGTCPCCESGLVFDPANEKLGHHTPACAWFRNRVHAAKYLPETSAVHMGDLVLPVPQLEN